MKAGRAASAALAVVFLVASALAVIGGLLPVTAYAAGNSIHTSPTNGVVGVNNTVTVELRENSGGTQVNAVLAELNYSSNLQFVSADPAGSAFDVEAERSNTGSTVNIARGSTRPLTGDQLVIKIAFKALSVGEATVQVDGSGSYLANSADGGNVASVFGGSKYSIVVAGSAPKAVPTNYPIQAPADDASPNVSITSNPTADNPQPQPKLLPNQSEVDVSGNSTIETTPGANKDVRKVEYLLNNKLTLAVNEPPYSYSVNTTNLRNGRYKLTTKTYYADGKVDSVDSVLNVRNKFGAKQFGLQLLHFAWLIILLALAAGGFIYYRYFRNGGSDDYGAGGQDGGYGSYVAGQYDPYGGQYPSAPGGSSGPGTPLFPPTPPVGPPTGLPPTNPGYPLYPPVPGAAPPSPPGPAGPSGPGSYPRYGG